jgi:hypothetical protein
VPHGSESDSSGTESDAASHASSPDRKRVRIQQTSAPATSAGTSGPPVPSRSSTRLRNADATRMANMQESEASSVSDDNDGAYEVVASRATHLADSNTNMAGLPTLRQAAESAVDVKGKGKGTAAAKGQGRGKAVAPTRGKKVNPLVDEHGVARVNPGWLACPVVGCKGDTDLSCDNGSKKGAWEMFV